MTRPAATPGRWLGPVPIAPALRELAWSGAAGTSAWVSGPRWIASAIGAGVLPLAIFASAGRSWHQPVTGVLVFLLVTPLLRERRHAAAIGAICVGFAAHSALAIALAYAWPQELSACMPDAAAYWQHQEHWIRTGEDPEYVLANWLPAHFQLLGAVGLVSYLSLGLGPLLSGLYEVDLMNFYVGRLLASGDGSPWLLVLGWHPWSLLRGACYAVLTVELASFSLERLSGRVLATAPERRRRIAVALACFGGDCVVKYVAAESVRGELLRHMLT